MTSRIKSGFRLTKDGKKLTPSVKHLAVSKRLQIQGSKKLRVARPGNPLTGTWTKRDQEADGFMTIAKGKPFKGKR